MVDIGEFRSSVILKGVKRVNPEGPVPLDPAHTDSGAGAGMASNRPLPSENGQPSVQPQPRSKQEDHYGFLYSMSEAPLHYDPLLEGKKAREREAKWLKMLDNWDEWIEHRRPKLKDRCRKGIPPSLRGRAWQRLCGSKELLEQNPGEFEELVSKPDSDIVINVIDKDLDRTFPSHVLFAKAGSQGQADLRRVLKAYANYNTKTGYCQAMAPVAATLLMHMTAEESFWCLVQICEQYLPGYYSPGLHAFQIDALILKDLLRKYLPNIKAFMDSKLPPNPDNSRKELDPMLYCTEWFMSIFTRTLPWPTVLRVWDTFFFEGVKVMFKVALALLHMAFASPQSRKECPGFFELTRKLRNLPIEITHENTLLTEMGKFRLHTRELHQEHLAQAGQHFTEERVRVMEIQARRMRSRSTLSVTSQTSDAV